MIRTVDRIPGKFLKHIAGTDGLFEIRVQLGTDIFRIFCCFDSGRLVILFNAFHKKSQKTPRQEIEKAIRLMNNYFREKKG